MLRMASVFGGLMPSDSHSDGEFFGFKEWSRFWEEDVVYVRPPWGSQAPLMRGKPMTSRIVKIASFGVADFPAVFF